jgi:hypothetical protein
MGQKRFSLGQKFLAFFGLAPHPGIESGDMIPPSRANKVGSTHSAKGDLGHRMKNEPILDILKGYPSSIWKFSFSESRVHSHWSLRATGTCINHKGAAVTFEVFAPPTGPGYESGYVKVTVDTICVFRQEWDGYELGPDRSVREEVLRSPYWKWIEARYEANLLRVEELRRNEMAAEEARVSSLYDEAIEKL